MASSDASGWLIALIGTLAGIVGACATVIQVFQNRERGNSLPPSTNLETERAKSRFSNLNEDVRTGFVLALWATLIVLLSWLALVILKVRAGTIPAGVVAGPSGLIAIWSIWWILVAFRFDLSGITEDAMNNLTSAITIVIDVLIVIAAIKIVI
jgi:hypothetical protein